MNCEVSQQIDEYGDEPEQEYCPECGGELHDSYLAGLGGFLECSECEYHNAIDE